MKEVGFVAVAGLVGAIAAQYLPEFPGLMGYITFIGTVAAIAGAVIAIPVAEKQSIKLYLIVATLSVAMCILGFVLYLTAATMEPGAGAALLAYTATAVMFIPIGLLVELAGLKIVE